MGNLTNQYVSQSYQGLLKLDNSNTGVTATLQYVQDGLGHNIPMLVSTSSVVISGSLFGTASYATQALSASYAPDTTNTSSLVTTSSFNAYTASNDGKVNSLIAATASYVTEAESGSFMITGSVAGDTLTFTKGNGSQFSLQVNTGSLPSGTVSGSQQIIDLGFATTSSVNQKLDTGSFNTYTSSNDGKVNSLINATGSYATTSSLTALSQSIASTDLAQNNRLTSIEGVTGSFATTSSLNSLTSSFNAYTSSNDSKVNALINATGSYATTGSNVFQGSQTISGSLDVTGSITALSASFTYLKTIYETSSVIFSSGSNIFGDEASDVQTLNGTVNIPLGNLNVTGSTTSSLGFFGNLQGTASYALQALSASYAPDTTNTGSLVTSVVGGPVTFENTFTVTKGDGSTNTVTINNVVQSNSASYSNYAVSASQAQNAVSASQTQNAVSSSYSTYAENAGLLNGTGSGVFATTGSNTFIGTQNILNDVTINSSNPFGTFVNLISTGTTSFNMSSSLTQFQSNGQMVFANTLSSTGSSNIDFNAQNGGNINFNTFNSGSVNITGSLNVRSGSLATISNNTTLNINSYLTNSLGGQSNFIRGWGDNLFGGSGASQANYTGSLRITGSNNIVSIPQIRASGLGGAADLQGYISGSDNMIMSNFAGIYLSTGSLLFPKTQNNVLGNQSSIQLYFTTSSIAGGHPIVSNNLLAGGNMSLQHFSGSVNSQANCLFGGSIISIQNFVTNQRSNINNNNIIGSVTLNHISSSINFSNNYVNTTAFNVNNAVSSSIVGNTLTVSNNVVFGASANNPINIFASGSQSSNATRTFSDNIIGGRNLTISSSFVSQSNSNLISSLIVGNGLSVFAQHTLNTSGGSAFLGRFNDALIANAQEIVFAVGTGTATGTRRTGLYITSGSLVGVSGSMDIKGSTTFTGSLGIATGSLAQETGSYLLTYDGSGSVKYATPAQVTPSLFNVGVFYSTETQSGSANVSQSINYNVTDISQGISLVSGSQLTFSKAGTYNIQFSAQLLSDTGADDVRIWVKKNGTNVPDTAGRVTLANNDELMAAWNYVVTGSINDYYELVWQNTLGNAEITYNAAAGNYPAVASIITTVTQVR